MDGTDSILSQLALREPMPGDTSLIYSSWLKSHRKAEATRALPNEVYFDGQRALITSLLKRSKLRLLVSREDPSHIYGWACFEMSPAIPVLHYVYIKHPYRGLGLARTLLNGLLDIPVAYTHAGEFTKRLAPGSYFNPYKVIGE